MSEQRTPSERLLELFAGLVENAFYGEIGLADPELATYVARLLSRFVHVDEIYPPSRLTGWPVQGIAEMLEELQAPLPDGERGGGEGAIGLAHERAVHRHVGDFALFWAGLFPDTVRFHAGRIGGGRDALLDYVSRGKRSYLTAAQLSRGGRDLPPRELLQRLSTHFELCVRALDLVRRQWRPERVAFGAGQLKLLAG